MISLLALLLALQDPALAVVPPSGFILQQDQAVSLQADAAAMLPPVAGDIATSQLLVETMLRCNVTGATAPVTYQWQVREGPASAPFSDPTSATTTVSFIDSGTYVIRCVVSSPPAQSTHKDWVLVVGANYVLEVPPSSGLAVTIEQIPPADVTDKIKPVISKVLYGALQLTNGQVVNLVSSVYAGFNVTSSDNTSVMSAQLMVDGYRVHTIGTGNKIPPAVNLWWLDGAITPGNHPAVIRVFDGSGNMAEFRLTLRR